MKKLMITALLMMGMASYAQQTPTPEKETAQTDRLTSEQRQQLHLKKLTLDLNLNASQQKEFSTLLQEASKKREAAVAERKAKKASAQKASRDERFAMRNKILDEQIAMKEKVRKILSAEQFAKWEKLQEDRKKDFGHKMKKHGRDKREKKE